MVTANPRPTPLCVVQMECGYTDHSVCVSNLRERFLTCVCWSSIRGEGKERGEFLVPPAPSLRGTAASFLTGPPATSLRATRHSRAAALDPMPAGKAALNGWICSAVMASHSGGHQELSV